METTKKHVVVLTLTRTIKSVVIGQAPVTLWSGYISQGKKRLPRAVRVSITAEAIHASAPKNKKNGVASQTTYAPRPVLVHAFQYSHPKTTTTSRATQETQPIYNKSEE